ncbi:DUF1853 family protein [Herminiimonas sp. CN]|uniref:DUF1853 family protein n=1 Tax=Herminiimonas sp. CN TaxID=1349818 RepID=UPI000473FF12|nr:DUF1853 family protein [Herminiimonas sp. CN]
MSIKPPTETLSKPALPVTCQADFHRRWGHLRDPHVRSLAWLLSAPDLLDLQAPQWRGLIATLGGAVDQAAVDWLAKLDAAPAGLHAFLDIGPFTRLGRYAEKLLAYYFLHQGTLFAHGIQVRASKDDTVGEFDFLLWDETAPETALLHWEFATKFYLLESGGAGLEADYFVGPSLTDTLGAKMRKILDRQLLLAQHPAAQIHLPQPVVSARALIKGWLFYHGGDRLPPAMGLSPAHCRGFWCTLPEFAAVRAERLAILPRLSWLAPVRMPLAAALDKPQLISTLAAQFEHSTMPVMVALLRQHGDCLLETSRGFIVPDDWRGRAHQRRRRAI